MYEFDRTEPVTLALRAVAGIVEIDAGRDDTVRVEVVPLGDSPAARQTAESTRVVLDGDTLVVAVPSPERWRLRRAPALRITVRVPAGSSVSGDSSAAEVRATGLFRDVHLKLASAACHLGDLLGDLHLSSASGELSVGRVAGSAYLKSASGTIRTGDVMGDVTAKTASGDIRIGSGGGSVDAGTASGHVTVGSLWRGRARLRTASGDITVGIAPGTGVWLDLSTVGGATVTDLTSHGDSVPVTTGLPSHGDSVPVTTGLDVRARSASGNIRIHRASAPGPYAAGTAAPAANMTASDAA
ncbi:hypothetical protein Acy02nite_06160 [Actinoplanes cyaneus]|uniref:DUF4097 domain-containing protein n=1 Tax=Actinoplanes cyaneus TaxID=52696 RepID=A0A919LY86_9ACTN|nr:DUF4097 family beta strand repeat-containing protein [Actinoplanes cyaneus]MCW2135900.1 putative adhesin [Actinoplanes cyaneus]GID62735.1 hypothetical protein Acy02nite_06160 [Actinoplanes cyaneus]